MPVVPSQHLVRKKTKKIGNYLTVTSDGSVVNMQWELLNSLCVEQKP